MVEPATDTGSSSATGVSTPVRPTCTVIAFSRVSARSGSYLYAAAQRGLFAVAPWVVTMEALEPFRCAGPVQDDPKPLEYLTSPGDCAYDIHLEVQLQSETMTAPATIATSNFKYMYWSICQQLAHHTVNGCNAQPGDLYGSGTISGPEKHQRGSMLELSWRGTEVIELPNGEERKFLADGDTVTMAGRCEKEGIRVGFGEVTGTLLPARG